MYNYHNVSSETLKVGYTIVFTSFVTFPMIATIYFCFHILFN